MLDNLLTHEDMQVPGPILVPAPVLLVTLVCCGLPECLF